MIKIFKKLIPSFVLFFFLFSAPQVFASALPKPPNNLGLVGYWSMNDCRASQATDFSGNGNIGTLTNFALTGSTSNWVTGKRGCALDFDATNDYVEVADSSSLDSTGASSYSYGMWIKTTQTGNRVLFEKGSNSYMMLQPMSATDLYINTTDVVAGGWTGFPDGSWHHIFVVYDISANTATLYRDGTSVAVVTSAGAGAANNGVLHMGSRGGSYPIPGSIDDVRIYNRALTGAEVTALYGSGATKIRTSSPSTGNFAALGQTSRVWRGMTAAPNGNVYAAEQGGDIYMQTAGVGTFNALSQTSRVWQGMAAAPNGNVYAVVASGDIYMQTAGTGTFNPLSQTARNWRGIAAAPNGNIYASVTGGDIYMQTAGTGTFNPLSQTSRNWRGMAVAPNGNVYAAVDGGDIYMQTAGTGTFNPLGQTSRLWWGVAADAHGNVYVSVDGVDIFKQTNGTGNFIALGQTARGYQGTAAAPNGNIYAVASGGDIYMRSAAKTKINATTAGRGGSLTSGLVGHWTFDGSKLTTTTATDSSTNANNGTLTNGPTPALGKLGQALSFDGVDDYVDHGNPASLQFSSGTFSAAFWIKPNLLGSYQAIIGHGVGSYKVMLWSDNAISLARAGTAATSGPVLSTNQWQHVVVVNNIGTDAKFYVNGVLIATNAFTHTYSYASNIRLGDSIGETQPFSGSLDDVRVYNRELTASEVTQLYNLGR